MFIELDARSELRRKGVHFRYDRSSIDDGRMLERALTPIRCPCSLPFSASPTMWRGDLQQSIRLNCSHAGCVEVTSSGRKVYVAIAAVTRIMSSTAVIDAMKYGPPPCSLEQTPYAGT